MSDDLSDGQQRSKPRQRGNNRRPSGGRALPAAAAEATNSVSDRIDRTDNMDSPARIQGTNNTGAADTDATDDMSDKIDSPARLQGTKKTTAAEANATVSISDKRDSPARIQGPSKTGAAETEASAEQNSTKDTAAAGKKGGRKGANDGGKGKRQRGGAAVAADAKRGTRKRKVATAGAAGEDPGAADSEGVKRGARKRNTAAAGKDALAAAAAEEAVTAAGEEPHAADSKAADDASVSVSVAGDGAIMKTSGRAVPVRDSAATAAVGPAATSNRPAKRNCNDARAAPFPPGPAVSQDVSQGVWQSTHMQGSAQHLSSDTAKLTVSYSNACWHWHVRSRFVSCAVCAVRLMERSHDREASLFIRDVKLERLMRFFDVCEILPAATCLCERARVLPMKLCRPFETPFPSRPWSITGVFCQSMESSVNRWSPRYVNGVLGQSMKSWVN